MQWLLRCYNIPCNNWPYVDLYRLIKFQFIKKFLNILHSFRNLKYSNRINILMLEYKITLSTFIIISFTYTKTFLMSTKSFLMRSWEASALWFQTGSESSRHLQKETVVHYNSFYECFTKFYPCEFMILNKWTIIRTESSLIRLGCRNQPTVDQMRNVFNYIHSPSSVI